MGKGKYKRKKQHAQRIAQQTTKRGVVMEQKKITEDKAEPATKPADKPTDDKNPSRWLRFKYWVRDSSSFTDWCIAAFTLALAVIAVYQFRITDGQLDVMRK